MSAARHLDLAPAERRIVPGILGAALPPQAAVWVSGSRATGRARPYSDRELAIDCGRPLSLAILGEAFEDSNPPYRVDTVGWHAADPACQRLVAAARARLAGDADRGTA